MVGLVVVVGLGGLVVGKVGKEERELGRLCLRKGGRRGRRGDVPFKLCIFPSIA